MNVVIIEKVFTYSAPAGEVGFEGNAFIFDVCIAEGAESYVNDLNKALRYKRTGRLVKVEYRILTEPDDKPRIFDV